MRNVFPGGFLALALLASGSADAQTARAMRQHIESSMVVTGNIDIDSAGVVTAVVLDKQDALPSGIARFVHDAAMQWLFEPVVGAEGVPVAARAPMSVRVVARKVDEEKIEIAVRSASFTRYDAKDMTSVVFDQIRPPRYPESSVRAGVSGDTYHMLKIGRDGRVLDVALRQVNLRILADESSMSSWRRELARASESVLKRWTFRVPTEGPDKDAPYWVVTVPISYRLSNDKNSEAENYGTWTSYVRGPLQPVPWIDPADVRNKMSPDALADGDLSMERRGGLKLLTPLDKG